MQKWTLLISIAFVFAGCADLKKSEQLERIDMMSTELDTWKLELLDFDKEQWKQWMENTETSVTKLKQLEADTVSLETAMEIDTYRKLQKKLPGLAAQQNGCLKDINAIQKRLKKLRSDIEKGNGRRDKYDSYLNNEEQEMEILEAKCAFYQNTYETVKKELPLAQENINELISERIVVEEVQ